MIMQDEKEFELIFDQKKEDWVVLFHDKEFEYRQYVSVRFLIDPEEDEKMFHASHIYVSMLKWLKKYHQEFFI